MTDHVEDEKVLRKPVEQRGERGFVCVDYHIIQPRTGQKLYPPDAMGKEIGQWIADLFDIAALGKSEVPERCKTCAFRRGTAANKSAFTISDAVGCLVESGTFYCHDGESHFSNEMENACRGHTVIADSPVGVWLREQKGKFSRL